LAIANGRNVHKNFGLTQKRRIRPILLDGKQVAELSLDKVEDSGGDYKILEVELKDNNAVELLNDIDKTLVEMGFKSSSKSKYDTAKAANNDSAEN